MGAARDHYPEDLRVLLQNFSSRQGEVLIIPMGGRYRQLSHKLGAFISSERSDAQFGEQQAKWRAEVISLGFRVIKSGIISPKIGTLNYKHGVQQGWSIFWP